ncbi:peptidase domain-containing ABC transporter [Longispora albida]|uniref:peptidase domain-containing ABC transporter n=1 Tax=Longispora albida TaxID=203523 RepID=UPI00036A4D33|nr:peptidase domain-containing ABC transporter [Longispora albida]
MLTRRRVPQFLQLTQTECGLSCTQMLLAYHGVKETSFALRDKLDVGRDGASLDAIAGVFRERGFQTRLYRANLAGLRRLGRPFIAFWENYHYVVVEKITNREVLLNDPAVGRRKLAPEEFTRSFSRIALDIEPTADIDRSTAPRRSPWRYFLAPLARSKPWIAAIVLVSLLLYLVTIGTPILTARALDSQLRPGATGIGFLFFLALAGGALVYYVLNLARVQVVTHLTVRVGRELMGSTFQHLLRLPYRYFSLRPPGELIYRLSSVNAIRDLLSSQLVGGILDIGMLLCLAVYMAVTSPQLSVLVLVLFLAICGVLLAHRRAVAEAIHNELTELSKSQSMQLEAIVSIAALKLSGTEDHFFQRWQRTFDRSLSRLSRRSLLQGRISAIVTVIQTAGPVLILFYGLYLVRSGSTSIGTVVAFQGVAATFFGLASSIFGSYTQFLLAESYLERLDDIVQAEPLPEREDGVRAPLAGAVTVRSLSFSYTKDSPDVLSNISFDVTPGQKIAVVGTSGCGKSTLGKILTGLYEPTSGSLLLDGVPLQAYHRSSLYDQIGYVPQEIALENRSVLDNIKMDRDATDDDVAAAAQAAQIHDEITRMPMGYQTLVSELGANFSGGQRQRLALARAILKKPRILVLDEATSSLDLMNETLISEYLSRQSCTRIVIAHRLTTVLDADQILVLDAGHIAERGTHRELMEAEGHYRTLFDSQIFSSSPSY